MSPPKEDSLAVPVSNSSVANMLIGSILNAVLPMKTPIAKVNPKITGV